MPTQAISGDRSYKTYVHTHELQMAWFCLTSVPCVLIVGLRAQKTFHRKRNTSRDFEVKHPDSLSKVVFANVLVFATTLSHIRTLLRGSRTTNLINSQIRK